MKDPVVGSCAHGNVIHYGYPCADCEADAIAVRVMGAIFSEDDGLRERISQVAAQAISDIVERVRRYEQGKLQP